MAVGHSNKEIAALDLSVKTVEVHKANAMRKLGLPGRTDVVSYALLQGWLRDPQGFSAGIKGFPPDAALCARWH